jgi:hypothetical protein
MRQLLALAVGVLAAAALAQPALASDDSKAMLGPSGYEPHGKSTLILAGTANVVLGSEDHVVICHAIGGPQGSDFNQIAPAASGVLDGHGAHEGDRDIIPPYVYESKKGDRDSSLAGGNNWSAATAAIYANGCRAPAQTSPPPPGTPQDVCPNIEGVQTSVPAGLTKDAAGNCVGTTTTVVQSQPPTQTVVIEKLVVTIKTTPAKKVIKKAKKAKKVKHVKKAKKAKHKKKAHVQVKGVRKAFTRGVLPHTR